MNAKDQRAQYSRLEEIFDRAVGITSPSDRQTYVLEACAGDAELLERLRVLLREHDCNDELFDAPESVCFSVTPEVPEYKRFGEFEIVREIGRGGMGVVYEAQQTSLKRRVALKILPVGSRLSKSSLVRFRREAEAAAKLHHTNIVPVYTTGIQDGTPYYAMELIEGPSLDHILDQLRNDSEPTTKGNASPEEQGSTVGAAAVETQRFTSSLGAGREYYDNVANVVADIAEALDHAHHHRIIHRDIKPSNLLITPEGQVIVTDFGLARVEEPGLTATGEMIGSPRYMSPEQISPDRGTLNHRTDIYSLGVTLYELITLRTAFSGENKATTLHEVVHREPKPPRQVDSKIPLDLDTICRKAMEKEPDRRYQSAQAMADDLRRFINRYQISARRIGPVGRVGRWCRRNRTVASLSLLLLALLVVGSALFGWQLRKQQLAQIAEWNRTLSSISLLREQGNEFDATRRLHAALQRFPAQSEELERVFGEMGRELSIMTERFGTEFRGAEIFARSIEGPTSDWLPLGTTPLSVRLPDGTYHIKCATDDASIITLQSCSWETVDWKITLPVSVATTAY